MQGSNPRDKEGIGTEPRQTCPDCGGPIHSLTRRGPGDAIVQPCGHEVGDQLAVQDAARGRAMPDGGRRPLSESGDEYEFATVGGEEHEHPTLVGCLEDCEDVLAVRENIGATRDDYRVTIVFKHAVIPTTFEDRFGLDFEAPWLENHASLPLIPNAVGVRKLTARFTVEADN